jgi:hypothetical protein
VKKSGFMSFMAWFFKLDSVNWLKGHISLESEEELNATTFQTYVYLVKVGKPIGPREVMREVNLSSPSVAYRNLQKLVDLGLVVKDDYSNYVVKEKVSMKGYVWVGKILMPSFAIFGFIFLGVLISEIVILIPHLLVGASIQESFWLLIVVTVVSVSIFIFEAVRFRNKPKH